MRYPAFIVALSVVLTWCNILADEKSVTVEGVYHLHNGYQSETLELRDGHFRYWFWSDIGGGSASRPIEGAYSVDGTIVSLSIPLQLSDDAPERGYAFDPSQGLSRRDRERTIADTISDLRRAHSWKMNGPVPTTRVASWPVAPPSEAASTGSTSRQMCSAISE